MWNTWTGFQSPPAPGTARHRTAPRKGRIPLAFADESARKRVLGRKLAAFTQHSITDRHQIETRLSLIRERFYEEALDEVRLGINALSAPVFRDDD